MTEAEWLTGDDPQAMLSWLGGVFPGGVSGSDPEGRAYAHRVTDRKLRLFACACVRRCREAKDLKAIAAVESAADAAASVNVYDSIAAGAMTGGCAWLAHADAAVAARHWAARKIDGAAALLRDVFGNPWRPSWMSERDFVGGKPILGSRLRILQTVWLTPTVLAVAHAAYDAGRIADGALDPTNLSVLADALEDAGCDCGELLDHLRSPGPHVRGCWAVDCILGRE